MRRRCHKSRGIVAGAGQLITGILSMTPIPCEIVGCTVAGLGVPGWMMAGCRLQLRTTRLPGCTGSACCMPGAWGEHASPFLKAPTTHRLSRQSSLSEGRRIDSFTCLRCLYVFMSGLFGVTCKLGPSCAPNSLHRCVRPQRLCDTRHRPSLVRRFV